MYCNRPLYFNIWNILVLLIILGSYTGPGLSQVRPDSPDQLFPFGPSNRDSTLPSCDNCYSNPISLKIPFNFFNKTYTKLYVNSRGTISFESGVPNLPKRGNEEHRNKYGPLIAPFWSYIDTTDGGQVHFRESTNPSILSKASDEIIKGFPGVQVRGSSLSYKSVPISSVFIVTWDKVAHSRNHLCSDDKLRDTFQAALIIAGDVSEKSFIIFYYNELVWTTGTFSFDFKCAPMSDYPAVAGFTGGNSLPFHELIKYCTTELLKLGNNSNVGEMGTWVFRVDNGLERPTVLTPSQGHELDCPVPVVSSAAIISPQGLFVSQSSRILTYYFLMVVAVLFRHS